MDKKDIPLNDDFETNPDREYIVGPYSRFDAELSRAAKEFVKKYKDLKELDKDKIQDQIQDKTAIDALCKLVNDTKLNYKIAVQNLASKKMLESDEKIIQYLRSLRENIMMWILRLDVLFSYAIKFKSLSQSEKVNFLSILDSFLSEEYGVAHSHISYSPDDTNFLGTYVRNVGDDRGSILFRAPLNSLDLCIGVFAHEFSHKITCENPNRGPLGAQVANIALRFYIQGDENKDGYFANADEMLSFAVEDYVSENFEQDLRDMAIRMDILKTKSIDK